jgi:hypothetical protein
MCRAAMARHIMSTLSNDTTAYLKEIMSIRSIEFPALHATALEISSEIRTDKGHCDRASPRVLFVHPRRDHHV